MDNSPVPLEFNGREKWVQQIHSITKDYPVVFLNSYQKPSIFIFYSRSPATTINSTAYRKNQYNIWGFDKEFYGKKAAIISHDHDKFAKTFKLSDGKKVYVHFTDKLISAQRLQVQILWKEGTTIERNKEVSVPVEIINHNYYTAILDSKEFPIHYSVGLSDKKNQMGQRILFTIPHKNIGPHAAVQDTLTFKTPDIASSQAELSIFLDAGIFGDNFRGSKINIEIK